MSKSFADELKAMGFSREQIAKAKTPDGKLLVEIERTSLRFDVWPYRSKWEAMYAMELEDQKRAGRVTSWQYEPMRLRLTEPSLDADGVAVRPIFYTPDFLVDRAMWGPLQLVEIKGYRRTKDINRFKLARDKFPYFEFVMVSWRKGGGWEVIM